MSLLPGGLLTGAGNLETGLPFALELRTLPPGFVDKWTSHLSTSSLYVGCVSTTGAGSVWRKAGVRDRGGGTSARPPHGNIYFDFAGLDHGWPLGTRALSRELASLAGFVHVAKKNYD